MDKDTLLELLAQDRLEELLDALKTAATHSGRADILREQVNLSGRLHRYKSRTRARTEDPEDLERVRNGIREDLRELVEHLYMPPPTPARQMRATLLQWRWPLLVLGISLAAVGIGMLPAPVVAFEASLLTTDLTFRLSQNWPKELTFSADRCDLTLLQEVRGDAGWQQTMDDQSGQPIDLFLDSGRIEIGPMHIPPASALSMRIRESDITLSLPEGSNGNIQAGSVLLRTAPSGESRRTREAELLEWIAEPGAQLTFSSSNDTASQLRRLPVQAVEFVRRDPGSDELKSAIQSGELRVQGRDALPLELDFLELDGLQDADISLQPQGKAFAVTLRGHAKSIRSGRQQTYSRKPTLLEHFYRDQKVTFFVGVLASLISLLWSVRRAVR
jgi:hypothetical protein